MIIEQLDTNLAGSDVKDWTFQLLSRPLFVPDPIRDYKPLLTTVRRVLEEPGTNFMAIRSDSGDTLLGVYGLFNVVPGVDARFACWLWDKAAVTPGLIKALKDFVVYSKDFHALRRVTVQSACEKMNRILELVGFKVEGRFRHGFKWNGKFHNMYQLRIIGG